MKLKINWKELGRQVWAAIKPVLLAAIGGGIVSVATREENETTTGRGDRNNLPKFAG